MKTFSFEKAYKINNMTYEHHGSKPKRKFIVDIFQMIHEKLDPPKKIYKLPFSELRTTSITIIA